MKDKLSLGAQAKKTGYNLLYLPLKYKLIAIKIVIGNIGEDEKKDLFEQVQKIAYPARQSQIESYMESAFERNMKVMPVSVAHRCLNYHRIKKNMLPFYICLAQKVKRRITSREYMRRKKPGGIDDEVTDQ